MLNTASQPPRRCSHHPVACPPGLASPLDTSSLNIPATTFSSLSMLLQPASSFTYWRSVPTHFVGAALLRGEWRHVVSLILGTGFHDMQVFYKWHGHVDAALRGMPGMLQWRELFGPTDSENQASFSFLHKKQSMVMLEYTVKYLADECALDVDGSGTMRKITMILASSWRLLAVGSPK
ncbi:uncharacterized protein LOC110430734 isoform X2 [Sorghum bicolor]|uniref:uncharacterized protein LOC110430734 isoform X2 n=1 Tax=Sorghum bicolor TaxID=4558 RepID=UPI000B425337|nr:uncharacterized protein LOC110430734 isoform X2 [Sorghum bicolor]|eukprot:XP_021304281.1 uncharacterized protein LOC110430734 isoform X2 [Sorghum bicolor]